MERALQRLESHSGAPVYQGEIPRDTLAEFVFQAKKGQLSPNLSLPAITQDILDCLDEVNKHLYTGDENPPAEHLTRRLVFAVSGIVFDCLDGARTLRKAQRNNEIAEKLLIAAWRIQWAWVGLSAGDIVEDLSEYVRLEEFVRNYHA